jgi:hypothetical protein
MALRTALFSLVAFLLCWAVPDRARADVRPGLDTRDRKGFVPSLRLMSGPALHGPQGFTPNTRLSYALAGAINRRFVLGADLGVTAWWDDRKASFHGDTFAQLFIIKGLFARGSLGIASHTYVAGDRKAALGGSLGTGYEFAFGKKGFVSLELDYDARVRTDRQPVRTVLFGLRIGGYIKK